MPSWPSDWASLSQVWPLRNVCNICLLSRLKSLEVCVRESWEGPCTHDSNSTTHNSTLNLNTSITKRRVDVCSQTEPQLSDQEYQIIMWSVALHLDHECNMHVVFAQISTTATWDNPYVAAGTLRACQLNHLNKSLWYKHPLHLSSAWHCCAPISTYGTTFCSIQYHSVAALWFYQLDLTPAQVVFSVMFVVGWTWSRDESIKFWYRRAWWWRCTFMFYSLTFEL